MKDTKQISSLHHHSWPQGASDRGWKLILFSTWQNSAMRPTEWAISLLLYQCSGERKQMNQNIKSLGFKTDGRKKTSGNLFVALFALIILWLPFSCQNFEEYLISLTYILTVLAVCLTPLQRHLGAFWSHVFAMRKRWETGKRGFLLSTSMGSHISFSTIIPIQVLESGFILQPLWRSIQDFEEKYSGFSSPRNP